MSKLFGWTTDFNPFGSYDVGKALSNVAGRASKVAGTNASLWNKIKYSLKPQRAYASESQAAPYGYDISGKPNPAPTTASDDSLMNDMYNLSGLPDTGETGGYSGNLGGTGGGAVAPTAPQYAWWQGKQYNWNDPNERNVYADARKQYINSMYDRIYSQSLEDINTSEANLGRERSDWMANYETGLQGLDKAKKGRDFGINSWYSSVAPNIYQSAEGEALKESQGTYDQGITEANRQKESAVNYFDQSQNQIARSRAGLGDINFQRQAELDKINQILSDTESQAEANRLSSMGSTGATYNPYGKSADISSFTNLLSQVYGSPTNPGNNKVGYVQNPNSRLGIAVMNLQSGKATQQDIQLLNEYGIVG